MANSDFTLSISNFVVLAITSGLVAGIITTVGNVFIAIWNKKSDAKLEQKKYLNSVNDYRCKELSKLLIQVNDCEEKISEQQNNKDLDINIIDYETDIYETLYNRTKPFLDIAVQKELESLFRDLFNSKTTFWEQLESKEDIKSSLLSYMVESTRFGMELRKAIQRQLTMLILPNGED